jgi:hypothetical protein
VVRSTTQVTTINERAEHVAAAARCPSQSHRRDPRPQAQTRMMLAIEQPGRQASERVCAREDLPFRQPYSKIRNKARTGRHTDKVYCTYTVVSTLYTVL